MDSEMQHEDLQTRQDNWANMLKQFFKSDQANADVQSKDDKEQSNDSSKMIKMQQKKGGKHKGNQSKGPARDRYSTLDFLKCLENTLHKSIGISLHEFAPDLHSSPCFQRLNKKGKRKMKINHQDSSVKKKPKTCIGTHTRIQATGQTCEPDVAKHGKDTFYVHEDCLPDLPADLRYLAKINSSQIVVVDGHYPLQSIPVQDTSTAQTARGQQECVPDPLPSPTRRPLQNIIVLCMDEGKQGWAATHFLTSGLNMNIIAIRDPIHRAVNDWKQAVKQAGLWSVVNASTLAFNICYGPWGSESWWSKAKGAAKNFQNHADSSDLLFRWLEKKIAKATDDPFFQLNPELLEESLKSKGEHVSLCRWFSWVSAAREHLPMWWPRLAALIVAGLETKLFADSHDFLAFRSSSAPLLKNQLETSDGQADTAGFSPTNSSNQGIMPDCRVYTTQYQDPDIKQIRKASKNTLHACCRVMADDITYQKCMFIMTASIPFHDEHGRLTQTIAEGRHAALQLYSSWSFGSWLYAVRRCCSILTDLEALSQCNITVTPLVEMEAASSFILAKFEDYQCACLNKLVIGLMSNRIQSMLWHTDNIPGLLASLCHDDGELRAMGLKRLAHIVNCIRTASSSGIPFVTKRAVQSMLSSSAVAEIVSGLKDFNAVPDFIAERLRFIFSGYGSTEIIEKLFRYLRVEVEPRSCSRRVARERRYSSTIESTVLADLGHAEHALSSASLQQCGQGSLAHITESTFTPPALQTGNKYLSLVASRRCWPSPTPQKIAAGHGDLALFRILACKHAPYHWSDAIRTWHSTFLIPGKIYKPSHPNGWACIRRFCSQQEEVSQETVAFIILSHLGPVALAWPLEVVPVQKSSADISTTTVRLRMQSNDKLLSQFECHVSAINIQFLLFHGE